MQAIIIIPGEPIGQPRPRATIRAGHATVYDDSKHPVNTFKAGVRLAWRQHTADPPTSSPVMLVVNAYFARPKSMIWKKRAMPRVPHAKKPDYDNILKACADALNGLAYVDDAQIVQVQGCKFTCAGDEQPRTEIQLMTVPST